MSIHVHYSNQKPFENHPPVLKTDEELIKQREVFRESRSSNTDFETINQVFEIIRSIRDVENPNTLEELDMINGDDIHIETKKSHKHVAIFWKPSTPTCKFATYVGLAMRLKLERELAEFEKIKLNLQIKTGGHRQQKIIDKQINDKERISAALENKELINFLNTLV